MGMRLFFVLLTLGGSIYLFMRETGDRRYAIGALAASALGLLLQLNVISLRVCSTCVPQSVRSRAASPGPRETWPSC